MSLMNERKIALGSELVFLKRISLSGERLVKVRKNMACYNDTNFTLTCLSVTNKLWIASGFFTYIVKLKSDI